ncbi:Phosphatidylinositol 4-kinase pik1alpha (PI4-kinase)(PtdIns-4-kinase), partial [Kickxella alabastrina]
MTQMPDSPAHGGPSTSTSTSTSPRTNTVVVTTGGESTSNSSLLLRLFTSQFFDSWLAVSYLFRYPHIVGVQHYLCNELRKFPLEEVEFFLPQLVHLMITRPNESIAIESLLLDISLQSSHVAILLYWYLQAYLADLKLNPRTATFKHCQRIINQVQELLFTDIAPELIIDSPDAVQHAYLRAMESVISTISLPSRLASLAVRFRSMLRLAPQVRENLQAAIVGIGSTAASAGAPSLAPAMGWIAVAQGQCAKQPERIGEDTDLPPQQNMLSGKNRGPRASPHGRSVSVARGLVGKQIADAVNGADRSREELGPHSTTAIGHQSPFSAGCTEDSHESDSMALESAARVSVSQPATPVTFGAPGVSREDGQGIGTIAASNSLDAEDMRVGSAPERNSAVFNGSGASSDGPPKPAQRAAVGSRSPTPAERTSTDSCRTVAVMESFQRANSVFISGDTAEEERNNKRGFSSRKNYLTKAAKEFQRNAKTLDRRLGRPSDTLKGSLSNGDVTGFRESVGHVAGEDTAATMRETLDDLATYMECERQKLERRTGYFGAEIKFMTTLMDISQRVCAVSKAGRQQFLKAELTLLNHNLDRDTCIPLWCPDADGAHHHHHRIVRIPTDDTVVLNSAERAPYLLTLEVLEPEASLGHPDRARSSSIVGDGLCQPGACAAGVSGTAVGVHQDILSRSADIAAETFGSKAAPPVIITATSNLNERGSPDALQLSTSTSPAAMLSPLQTPATANAAAEEVDEQLMAEVFGDLDDVTSMPNMPMSPVANRRHSGNYASARQHPHSVAQPMYPALSHEHEHGGTFQKSPAVGLAPLAAQPAIPGASSGSGGTINGRSSSRGPISRVPVSQDDIRARMRTASVLLAQLARQQKALGIKMNNLVVPQPAAGGNIGNDSDTARSRGDISDTIKRRGKLSNATIQALAMEGIRDKLIREMMQLEELRLKQPGLDSVAGSAAAQEAGVEGDISLHEVEFKDDPSAKVLKEDWESKKARIRRT